MTLRDFLLALLVSIAWGGYFSTSKIALNSIPPSLFGFLRFFIVFLLTIPHFKKCKIDKKLLLCISTIYFLNTIIIYIATAKSNHLIPLIIMNNLVSPISLFLGYYFLKENLSIGEAIGFFLTIIGAAIVIRYRSVANVNNDAIIFSCCAAFLFSVYNLLLKKIKYTNPLSLISQTSLIVSIFFLITAVYQGELTKITEIETNSFFALAYSVIVTTLIANYLWLYLVAKYPLKKIVPFTILIPIFGSIICITTLNEKINLISMVGIFIVMLGLTIIEYKNAKNK